MSLSKALQIVRFDEDDRLILDEEVCKQLAVQGRGDELTVVAIMGAHRTGKSFLMNKISNNEAQFEVASKVQAHTKGIWVTVSPHPTVKGRDVIWMDAEGLGDPTENSQKRGTALFTLVVLLCNRLIYNATSVMDDGVIKQLQVVTFLTEKLRAKRSNNTDEEYGLRYAAYFPTLVMVLRDFVLELKSDGVEITASQYLERALKLSSHKTKKAATGNDVKQCIISFFAERHCFTLPQPCGDEERLKTLVKLPDAEIDPVFLAGVDAIKDVVVHRAEAWCPDGLSVTIKEWIEMLQVYVDAINNDVLLCIESTLCDLKNKQRLQLITDTLDMYDQKLTMALDNHRKALRLPTERPFEIEDLIQIDMQLRKEVASYCEKHKAMFTKDVMEEIFANLSQRFDQLKQENNGLSEAVCKHFLTTAFGALNENVKNAKYTRSTGGYRTYVTDKNAAIKGYTRVPNKGPMADKCIKLHLELIKSRDDIILDTDQTLDARGRQIERDKLALEEKKQERRVAEARVAQMKEMFLAEQEQHQRLLGNLSKRQDESLKEFKMRCAKEIKAKEDEKLKYKENDRQWELLSASIAAIQEEKQRAVDQHKRNNEYVNEMMKNHNRLLKQCRDDTQAMSEQQIATMTAMVDTQRSYNDSSQNGVWGMFKSIGGVAATVLQFVQPEVALGLGIGLVVGDMLFD